MFSSLFRRTGGPPAPSPPPPAPGYEFAGALASLPARGLTAVTLPATGGAPALKLCVVTAGDGAVHAVDDACPHKQASLSLGDIEDGAGAGQGLSIKCPKHRKPGKFGAGGFNVRVGDGTTWIGPRPDACTYAFDRGARAPVHDVIVHNGSVFVARAPRIATAVAAGHRALDALHERSVVPPAAADAPLPVTLVVAAEPIAAAVGFERAVTLATLPRRGLTTYVLRTGLLEGTPLCLVTVDGAVVAALYDVCPHKKAQLSLGDIEDADGATGVCVKCPRHRRKFPGGLHFRTADGSSWVADSGACASPYDPAWRVATFGVHVDGDGWVSVSTQPTGGSVPPPPPDGVSAYGVEDGDASGSKAGGDEVNTGSGGTAPPPPPLTDVSPAADSNGSIVPVVHTTQRHAAAAGIAAAAAAAPPGWVRCVLQSVRAVTGDSRVYRLVPAAASTDGNAAHAGSVAPPANPHSWHVPLRVASAEGGDAIERDYTPLSPLSAWLPSARGAAPPLASLPHLDLLIKLYAGGALTSRLARLGVGDDVWVGPPETTLATPALLSPEDSGRSSETAAAVGARVFPPGAALGLVAGGTGVTPMLQLARWALAAGGGEGRPSAVYLLLSFHTPADVLAASELRELAGDARLHLHATFSRAAAPPRPAEAGLPATATTSAGRVSASMLRSFFPPRRRPADAPVAEHLTRIVTSGPRGMMEAVQAAMSEAGHGGELLVELET